jgi:hypothetical protein
METLEDFGREASPMPETKGRKKISLEIPEPTTYPLAELLAYLKAIKKLGATHVSMSHKFQSPLICAARVEVVARDENGDDKDSHRQVEFALAPRIITGGEDAMSLISRKKPEVKVEAAQEVKPPEMAEPVVKPVEVV